LSDAQEKETRAGETPPRFDDAFRARFEELLRWRRDVRRFRGERVADDLLDHFLALANLAPSVGLSQPWRFVWVDDPDRRKAVRANFEACNAEALANTSTDRAATYAKLKLAGLDEAPHHLALFAQADPAQGHGLGRRTMPETVPYSAAMAAHTLWLAARGHGVGVGWVSILDPAALTQCLDVPTDWRFIGYFCVGYPAAEHETPELERHGWERRRAEPAVALRR
jgi:5,6-dimethylbenzimidazole synthase